MRCRRCQGLMVWDRFIDLAQSDLLWAFAWRCVNCGEVLDAVILSQRRKARDGRKRTLSCQQAIVIGSKGARRKIMGFTGRLLRKSLSKHADDKGFPP